VSAAANARRAAFLDRDGVINELVWDERSNAFESPYAPQDVALCAGAVEGIQVLRDAGFALVVVSNQPAAAKGTVPLAALEAVHGQVEKLLLEQGIRLDAYRYCHHHPDSADPRLGRTCACRKPEPGLIRDSAVELGIELTASWVVGDADRDVEAGHRAGCRSVLIENPQSANRRQGGVRPHLHASDLEDAAAQIVRATALR
jgi:D-glycero-D-manno-heptose 1,7-bisphosphate phosphatase